MNLSRISLALAATALCACLGLAAATALRVETDAVAALVAALLCTLNLAVNIFLQARSLRRTGDNALQVLVWRHSKSFALMGLAVLLAAAGLFASPSTFALCLATGLIAGMVAEVLLLSNNELKA